MIGQRLGSYEITAKLGEGGMGEVYRATDTKLDRQVAIKVLPAAFTEDKERLARFEREAKLLAQLHHPNIASIFGLEESDGTRALVMELVEGPTLAERLETGALPFNESLSVSLQIAHALEEAHEKGIVHRDLKPQNIKASIEGKVKVLDFGLAKAMDPAGAASGSGASASQLAQSPTLTLGATQMGVILGTAAYMSPEQAKGMPVDKRADIWSFGVVLFEMLTGQTLFAGDSVPDTLARVLQRDVDFESLPESTPPEIRRLLRRCLERKPRNRLHDIADARIVLEEVVAGRSDEPARSDSSTGSQPGAVRTRWPLLAGVLAAGLVLGVAAAALWFGRSSGAPRVSRPTQFAIQPPAGAGFVRGLAISPDGRKIAFVARGANGRVTLWVRALDALEARELPETDDARYPFWAPDSRRIGFFSQRTLKWTDSEGGNPLVVTSTSSVQDVRGAAWGAGDTILYSSSFTGPLQAVAVVGGASRPATRLPESGEIGTHRFPSFLPDGQRFVFYAAASTGTEPGYLHLGRLGSLDAKLLGPAHSTAVFAAPNYLIYARGESLVAHAFDLDREALVGEPVSTGVSIGGSLSVSGLRSVATAASGMLVFRSDKRNASQMVWVDRAGRELEALSDATSAWFYAPRLSPDGRFLLAGQYKGEGNLGEIWVHDLARKLATRLTLDGDAFMSLWLRPGSREVLYNSARPKSPGGIYRGAIDRPGEEQLWLPGETAQAPVSVTPDGRRVVFERADEHGKVSLWIRDLEVDSAATRLGSSTSIEMSADVSPDGAWLAYTSDTTRNWEVYVRRLDGTGGVLRISNEGGFQPLWRRDGRELFYVDANGRLVAVPIAPPRAEAGTAGERLQPGRPEILFQARLEESTDRQYDAAADGQRFVLNQSVTNDGVPIVVVLDWTALLEARTP